MSRIRRVELHDAQGAPITLDGFGRLRMSEVATTFENQMQYNLNPESMYVETTGTGSITHLPNESAAQLSTGGTASGAKATFQSKRYHRYQAGKSQLILMTGALGAAKASVRQRIGYFDDDNGLFFEQTDAGKYVVLRTSTSGSPVDTRVEQADWNRDKFDGTGPSGITLDLSKSQIFVIDFQWLGAGVVRFGFDITGAVHYCHEIKNANNITSVYMTTPHLPVRSEIENTGTAASATTLKQFCTSVTAEGGLSEDPGLPRAIERGSALAVTTRRPVMSIRPRATFNSITNRGHVSFDTVDVIATTNNCYWELAVGGSLTGASWNDVDTSDSITEFDISATAITGEVVVDAGYALAGLGASSAGVQTQASPVEVYNSFDGTTPEIITLLATSFSGTSNVRPLMRWTEQR